MTVNCIARWFGVGSLSRRLASRSWSGRVIGAVAMLLLFAVSSALAVRPPQMHEEMVKTKKSKVATQVYPNGVKAAGAKSDRRRAPQARATGEPEVPGPKPVIQVAEPVHDFGEMWIGPVLKHTFKIKNAGDAVLNIKNVKPSCGCTIAGNYPRTLKPGESGDFPFSIASTKLRGKFEKAITVTTNDLSNPNFRLRLRGQVKRYVEMTPMSIQFGKLYGKEAKERVIKLTNNTETPLELELADPLDGNFDVELVPVEKGKVFDLKVTAKPPFSKVGVFRKSIRIKTNIAQQGTLKVEMRGTIPERLDVKPTAITVRPRQNDVQQGRASTRVVRFTNYGDKPAHVVEASADDPALEVSIKEQRTGEAYNISVKFPPGYNVPAGGRTLTLKTDDPERPSIRVPIKSLAQARAKQKRRRPAQDLVGKPAPSFSLKTIDGKPLNNQAVKDKVTVLDFFAVNCGFCKRQIPRLEKVRADFASKGVRFVAVSQTMRNKRYNDDQVMDKIKELGFKGEVATDPGNTAGPLFKATSFPTMVVLGKTGKVEAVNIGNVGDLETRLAGQLDALLAGKPIPQTKLAKATAKKPQPRRKRADELIGKPAPNFSIATLDGKNVGNSEFSKHPATVLNFVAGNCGYCKKQIPRLEKIREAYAAKGVRFVNMVETMRTPFTQEQVVDKMKQLGYKGETAHDLKNTVGPLFNATSFPTMVLVGKTGKIEAVNLGNVGDLEKRMKDQLDALIAGKPVPKLAAARPKAQPQPQADRKQVAEVIGKPAPSFSTTTLTGAPLGSSEFAKYKATVLDFFAPNCHFCKNQIPRLEKIRQKYADKGVRFVAVSQKMRTEFSKDQVMAKIKELGFQGEVAINHTNSIGGKFGARGFPTMVIVGKSGNVEAVNVGNLSDLEKRMDAQLTSLIEGKPIPKFAATAPPKRSRRRPAEDLAGKPAPSFAFKTLAGNAWSNTDFSKYPATVLDFFAPNCGFCKRQLPTVEKIRKEYEAKGVKFIAVAQKMRKDYTDDQIVDVLKKIGVNIEISTSDFAANSIGRAFKAVSFPTMFVVDRTGKIANVNIGAKQNLESLLKGQLDALLGKSSQAPVSSDVKTASASKP